MKRAILNIHFLTSIVFSLLPFTLQANAPTTITSASPLSASIINQNFNTLYQTISTLTSALNTFPIPGLNNTTTSLALTPQDAPPNACTASTDGAVVLAKNYSLCICKASTGTWVKIEDGVSACQWGLPSTFSGLPYSSSGLMNVTLGLDGIRAVKVWGGNAQFNLGFGDTFIRTTPRELYGPYSGMIRERS
jgi:hypothetical protein